MKTRSIPIIVMGLSSILLQIISLRQFLTVFSGNELDIGITLSVWLVAIGMGSYAGHRLRFGNALAFSFLAIAFLSQPIILAMNLIRHVVSIEFGETISLTTTMISTTVILLPLCFVIGLQFPLAVSYLKGDTAKTYSLEAAGAFIGGTLFTLLFSGRVNVFALSMAVSIINLAAALLLLRKKSLIALLLAPVIFYAGINRINTMLQWKGAEVISRVESRYGEITVSKIREQSNVYASGKFQFSYPDVQAEELRSHFPMSIHPSAFNILIIGGSPAVLREFLKYPVSRVDFVEIDPEMVNVSQRLLSKEDIGMLNDKRVRIIISDGRRFAKALNAPDYDLVIVNLPAPATANINRFYTVDFFREVMTVLKKGGILCLTIPTSSGYISKRMQVANGSIYNSLKNVFPHLEVSSEEYGYIFASNSAIDINPQALVRRFSERGVNTRHFQPYILHDAFSPLKVNMVRERLKKIDSINQDIKPVAYLYNLMLWAEIHGGGKLNYLLGLREWQTALIAATAFIAGAVLLWRKKQPVYYSMFTTGYSAMAFSMIIILSYQASFGYVYEMIGLLTAFFMAGMAIGAYSFRGIMRPLRRLKFLEIASIMLFISAPLFFRHEIFFYALSLLCGIIAGMQFATANLCMREDAAIIAGRLYAVDLIGSFAGAFLTSIFLMPLLGVQNTILFLVLIKGISLTLLLSIKD